MPPFRSNGLLRNLSPMKALALAMALALPAFTSCSPSPKAGGGIGGTGSVSVPSVSSGAVTKLGNVHVAGTEYDDSNSLYCIDDEPCSTQNNLKLGMVVLVKGTAQSPPGGKSVTRVADAIIYQRTAVGIVQSVAPDGSSLIVLGQFVAVNQKTVIDESIPAGSIRNLKPGLDAIEVSGLVAGDGHIVATLITKRTGIAHYEVEGMIKNHDVGGKRFEIGQLVVEYSSADVNDMTADDIMKMDWNDRLVHVRGDVWQPRSTPPYGTTLLATRVTPLGLTVEDSAEAKLEGYITQVTPSGGLTINNHRINVSSDTVFEGGTVNGLIPYTRVLIHGVLVRGELNAQLVVFKENVQIESNVESIDPQSRTLTLVGLPGVSIETDAQTLIEDADASASSFEDIRPGDHLKIHARLHDGQRILAEELEQKKPSTAIVFQAPVQSAVDSQIVLANVSIDTSALPENEFVGSYGPIGRKTFFEKALIGRPVWGKGMLSGSVVTWSSVGINE